ncbi:MAG: DEAD/DEAH box helicase, partial [Clostridiaceae bacterium]
MEEIKFENYNLDQNIILALEKLGFDKPTKVQERVLPLALNNKDVIVKSKTGSGKTACFGIPICENIDLEEKLPQALIISPTRELSIQIKDDISKIGRLKKIRCLAVYGKEPIAMQKRKLSQRVHVVSGTPGRILDHLEKGSLNLDKVKYLILDEADKMLNMGFIKDVEKIIKYVPKKRTTMLFSATISEDIDYICRKHMMDAERIEIEEDKQENTIDECYYVTSYHEKYSFLLDVIYSEMPERCIIFCNTKETVANLTDKLKSKDFSCESIHGDMEQRDRIETMNRFKRDEFVFLIATDVAARGIHIDGISHVVNYDIPREKESYIHRIGRTGRAGEFGKAISVVTTGEVRILKEIEDYIDRKIEERFIENQTL